MGVEAWRSWAQGKDAKGLAAGFHGTDGAFPTASELIVRGGPEQLVFFGQPNFPAGVSDAELLAADADGGEMAVQPGGNLGVGSGAQQRIFLGRPWAAMGEADGFAKTATAVGDRQK